VRAQHPAVAAVLEHGVPVEMNAERVLVAYAPDSFLGAQASEPEALDLLTREVRAHFRASTRVGLDLSRRAKGPSVATMNADERNKKLAEARASVEGHPLVKEAIRVLGAELREVRLPQDE